MNVFVVSDEDTKLFGELERVYSRELEGAKADMELDSLGTIGDDYIGFEALSEEEPDEEEEETPAVTDKKTRAAPSRRPMTTDVKPLSTERTPRGSPRLFHPHAPWMPVFSRPSQLAAHYGFLSAPSTQWKHFSERLHQELLDLAAFLSPTEAEATARNQLIQQVDAVVRRIFPECHVKCFGSFETGLYLPTSDIDLVIVNHHPPGSRQNATSSAPDDESIVRPPLRRLARALEKAGLAESHSMQVIARARVPIIKYRDCATGLPVDISFHIASGLDGARFLKQQLTRFPAMRPILLFLKFFLDLRGLNEVFRGGLGSFSAACLLLSFLQLHPLVQLGLLRPEDNLGVLLMEMLELYGRHLNYEHVGISVGVDEEARDQKREDKRKSVSRGESTSTVTGSSSAFVGYYDKADREFLNPTRPALLSIQDPQCPENDLARSSFAISAVKQAFEHAFSVLAAAAHELDAQAHLLRTDKHHRPGHNRTDGSILASLISIPDRFLRHRDFIRKAVRPR